MHVLVYGTVTFTSTSCLHSHPLFLSSLQSASICQ